MTPLNNQNVQDIFEALTLNVKLSQDLLTLLGSETKALRAMDPQELLTISKLKSTLISKIQFLDDSLKNHIADGEPAALQGPPRSSSRFSALPDNSKLSGLIALLPEDKKEAARQCKEKLSKIRQDILVKNYINKKFTEDTLGYLGDAIALFTRPIIKQNTYSASGRRPRNASSLPQLISREV
jgi:flagellar biosynthesis/type III secretory pathway chaperone